MIRPEKISGSSEFLGIVLFLYVGAYVLNPDFCYAALFGFWKMIQSVTPILVLVFFVMFIVHLFIKPAMVKKYLGKDSSWKGWLYTMLGDILLAGPAYVMFPFLGEMKADGMKNSLIAVFLNNRNIQITFVPVLVYYFGTTFAFVLLFYTVIFAVLGGIVVGKWAKS